MVAVWWKPEDDMACNQIPPVEFLNDGCDGGIVLSRLWLLTSRRWFDCLPFANLFGIIDATEENGSRSPQSFAVLPKTIAS